MTWHTHTHTTFRIHKQIQRNYDIICFINIILATFELFPVSNMRNIYLTRTQQIKLSSIICRWANLQHIFMWNVCHQQQSFSLLFSHFPLMLEFWVRSLLFELFWFYILCTFEFAMHFSYLFPHGLILLVFLSILYI